MMKSILLWLSYEFLRPKAIWLFHYLVKLGEQQSPKETEKKKIIPKTYQKKNCQVTNKGNPNFKAANLLAKNIRNEEEKWTDALKRAHGQLKLLNNLEKKTQIKNRKWKTLSRTTD